ncbi:MAG: hypothetical protein NC123_08190 [Butyrivibrio sp.]|nr:hypothetical protein [Acetatifactor muris]MCM1559509.1 hypothetical protein [Butyrivibrio sp.]
MWKEIVTAMWLVPMSIMDTRSKKVPVWMLWLGAAAAAGILLYEGVNGRLDGWRECRSLLPGAVLLAVAYATGKAGMADGVILMLLGIFMGYEGCVAASVGGLFLIALFSGVLLALRRAKKDTRIPFVPFLTVGWLLVVCEGWVVQ